MVWSGGLVYTSLYSSVMCFRFCFFFALFFDSSGGALGLVGVRDNDTPRVLVWEWNGEGLWKLEE